MKKFLLMLAVAAMPMAAFVACKDDDDPPPGNKEITVKAEPGILNFEAADQEKQSVKVTTTNADSYVPTCEAAWVNITKTDDGFDVTVNEYTEAQADADADGGDRKPREAVIKVTAKNADGSKEDEVKVTQKAPEKDTPPPPPADLAEIIEGLYEVDIIVEIEGEQIPVEGASIDIIRTADNEITLDLKNFVFEVPGAGQISVPVRAENIALTGTEAKVIVAFDDEVDVDLGGGPGTEIPIPIVIDGTVEDGKTPEMNMQIDVDLAGSILEVKITGSRI